MIHLELIKIAINCNKKNVKSNKRQAYNIFWINFQLSTNISLICKIQQNLYLMGKKTVSSHPIWVKTI